MQILQLMQERLIQIVQILQLRRHSRAQVHFGFPLSNVQAKYAFEAAGFACMGINSIPGMVASGRPLFDELPVSFHWSANIRSLIANGEPSEG